MLEGCAAEPGAVVCITCQLGQAVSCDTPDSTPSRSLLMKSATERPVSFPVRGGLLPSFSRLGFCFYNLPIIGVSWGCNSLSKL